MPTFIGPGYSSVNSIVELSSRFKEEGMLAYVELIQRKEKELGCDILTHQKWLSTVIIDKSQT
jgi:isocitrate lyase